MQITWLSQGGFIFESDGKRVVVDPYLSNDLVKLGHDRMTPPPISYEEMKPDVVLFTHDHLDHYDPVTVAEIVKMYPKCKLVGTTSTRNHHIKLGYSCDNFTRFDLGDKFECGSMKFVSTYAYHSEPCTVGLVISTDEKVVYLSSDTLYDKNLSIQVKQSAENRAIDLAIVCINGKLGNMDWSDAFKLVSELNPKSAMPMHYGLFADNTQDPSGFIESVKSIGIQPIVADAGEAFNV